MADATQVMTCMEVWGGNALTDNSVSMSGLDAWVYSKPFASAEAGGDVYYVSSCATGRVTRLLVADVSGHGTKVADAAVMLRTLMRRFVNQLDQRNFVRSMNQEFSALSEAGVFATAVVMTFFGPTNSLTVCNAGHPTPLLYRAANQTWSLLERGNTLGGIVNIPLGIDDITDYEQVAVQLEVGDLVLCYSDSLIEAHDENGQMLGEAGLLSVARQVEFDGAADVSAKLLRILQSRYKGNLENDDVTVLLFRPNGAAPTVPLRDKLLAPFRVIGGVIHSLLPGGPPVALPDFTLVNIGGALFDRLNKRWRGIGKSA
jgi:serine phosphatase RsbU (regulator of sigma subunit)